MMCLDFRSVENPYAYVIQGQREAVKWVQYAVEIELFYFEGMETVCYGANGVYFPATFTEGSIYCYNDHFGDPLPGEQKTVTG
jgi:hypothetical protein